MSKPNKSVKPIPDGYHTLTPYLFIKGAAKALKFYADAFGAEELYRIGGPGPDLVGHAEMKIGDSIFMLADEMPEWGNKSPQTLGGVASSLMIYVKDVDTAFAKAVKAGAAVTRPLKDQFYGDRTGCVTDPFGHVWTLATHIEDLSPEEIGRRGEEEMAKMASA